VAARAGGRARIPAGAGGPGDDGPAGGGGGGRDDHGVGGPYGDHDLAVTVLGAVIYSGQYSFAQLGTLGTIGVLLLIALATLAPSAEVPTRAIAGAGWSRRWY
jgi:hypothetical protein